MIELAVLLNATLCWPMVNLEGYNSHTWKLFDALFDTDATETTIRCTNGIT
jgi:hypothetical protein